MEEKKNHSKIYMATRTRGFWNHLAKSEFLNYKFMLQSSFEVNTKKRNILYKLGHSRLCDLLGIIQSIKTTQTDAPINGSYNRFLESEKPYFIYLETPTALYHYSLLRNRTFLGRKKANKLASSSSLKGIVCMSNACSETFDSLCFDTVEKHMIKRVIYPLVPDNPLINEMTIVNRCAFKKLKLLFIAQHVRLVSKGVLNILEMMNGLNKSQVEIELTIITNIEHISQEVMVRIQGNKNIKLIDFNLNFKEMEAVYAAHHILIHPTSDDSSPLTILEAMKAGLPVISTKLFAIPEMIVDGYNGFLTEPQWEYYYSDNMPNPEVWNHRSQTRDKMVVSKRIVNFLIEKVMLLHENRNILEELSLHSYKKACNDPFSEECISKQWNDFLNEISKMEKL